MSRVWSRYRERVWRPESNTRGEVVLFLPASIALVNTLVRESNIYIIGCINTSKTKQIALRSDKTYENLTKLEISKILSMWKGISRKISTLLALTRDISCAKKKRQIKWWIVKYIQSFNNSIGNRTNLIIVPPPWPLT